MSAPDLVVVDTNVVVSGLITREKESPSAAIVDAMLSGRLRFVASVELVAEYRAVLFRPRIRSFHGLAENEVDRIVRRILENAAVREPRPSPVAAPDPGDQHLWDLLSAEPAAVLLTGDRTLLELQTMRARVCTPREFVDL